MKFFSNPLYKLTSIFIVLVLIFSLFPTAIVFANDDNEKETIRVGYLDNYGIIKSPMIEGYEGYGYEYLRKMEDYIDYEFEFVLCDWSNIINMLRSGELDVIAPMRVTDERLEEFYFTNHIFAKEIMLIISDDIHFIDEDSYDILNGSTIGVRVGGASYYSLVDFIDEYDIDFNIVGADTTNFANEVKKDEYDYLLTGSLQLENDLNIALNLGTSACYFMSNSQEIVDILDLAMTKIEKYEYLFQEELQSKYFHREIGANHHITDEEFQLIQSESSYNVGVVNMYRTFGYSNEKEINNISVDVINFISDLLSIDINFVEINDNTTYDELDKLDFYIHLNGYETDFYDNFSNPFMEDKLLSVTNNTVDEISKIGVLDYYNLDELFFDNDKVIYYSNIRSLLDAFNIGEVSTFIIAESVYELMYSLIHKTPHTTRNLNYPILPAIIYTNDFPVEKIAIIDKAISYLTDENINTMLLSNLTLIANLERRMMYNQYINTFLLVVISVGILFTIFKINKRKELELISNFDKLTGLYTQGKFIKETHKLLDDNPNKKFSMISFDIDNFKYVNELFGFENGDLIIAEIGRILIESHSFKYPITRIASDHFICVIPNDLNVIDNNQLLERISALRSHLDSYIGDNYELSISAGCYIIEDISISVELMIDYSNLARSYSKKELGTAFTVYSNNMKEKEDVKNNIIHKMNKAIEDKEFVLYYQPKFDVLTMEIVGAEALVRWFSDGKMMPPNDFIPLFEKNGFIEKLDYYVLESACQFIKEHNECNIPLISVNLSSITIMKSDVVENIFATLQKYSLKPEVIELEITESAFVDHFEIALTRINKLREKGFKISMDDFGAGVSSLGRLKNMEIDVLKIDREFIIETLENDKSDTILKNIIKMANQLELETIAEGIETIEQLNFLKDNGCKSGQGYYFARPLPQNEFIEKLNEKHK